MPEVSIIIRTKNEERWINLCLQKIFSQSFTDFEVIIVDNYSSDRTIEKVKEYNENENGNRPSFFWDEIKGHFEMVEIGQQGQQFETIIYTSDKPIGTSGQYYPPVINAGSIDGISAGGTILDNSNINPSNYFGVRCQFSLDIISNNPTQAVLKVKSLSMSGDTYNIPSNITMTKQF